mgnify:FL=1
MKKINVIKLDEEGYALDNNEDIDNYFDDGGDLPVGNYVKEDTKPVNIEGEWLVVNELMDVENDYLTYAQRKSDNKTLIQLPGKYVEEDYLVDYDASDECPLGIDVLVREDGFNVNVVPGCDYKSDANVNNHLDGHKYSGYLGFKLNEDYFVTYKNDKFQMISL